MSTLPKEEGQTDIVGIFHQNAYSRNFLTIYPYKTDRNVLIIQPCLNNHKTEYRFFFKA